VRRRLQSLIISAARVTEEQGDDHIDCHCGGAIRPDGTLRFRQLFAAEGAARCPITISWRHGLEACATSFAEKLLRRFQH
jgi:hypothetical protein